MLILAHADLISGAFGLLGSVALAIPPLRAIRGKKYWEKGREIQREFAGDDESSAQLESLLREVEDLQLGGTAEAVWCNFVGFGLLAVSFSFLIVAALQR